MLGKLNNERCTYNSMWFKDQRKFETSSNNAVTLLTPSANACFRWMTRVCHECCLQSLVDTRNSTKQIL